MGTSPDVQLPPLPVKHDQFIQYVANHPDRPMLELLEPFNKYDAEMRKLFAQHPKHEALQRPTIVPIFEGHEQDIKVRARNLEAESIQERESYIMPLTNDDRKPSGSSAMVNSLRDFKTNFNVFSESSLVDLDFSNIVVAGSAVVTSLMPVPEKHAGSKRALREYYHEKLAPASDVDIFMYGLTEDQAKEKLKQIERNVRDALLVESTVVRTKNAITIVSQYPTRHVQIVLRIYKSISEILTGFDVDCSCVAYDGSQVFASPRALAAFITQINTIDLTRRSPSYESRLSKYSRKRGFEVSWPDLDRSKIDPTIFERSFSRTEGLARLLVLEKLPSSQARDEYLDKRRAERGRPAIGRWRMQKRLMHGNIKDDHEDEVAEWVDSDEVSDYHTFTIPYGPKFHAKKTEKLIYTKDLLLNSEWNKPKDREANLHRHPAFFGTADDVLQDCCGHCPQPTTVEEEELAEEESQMYIHGAISFIKDDPGRQAIGSFKPLTADDWTKMCYVSNTAMLCQAIVDGDVEYVQSWLEQTGNDVNARDWSGRTPLHLAVSVSTIEMVQLLIDQGARLVARLADGKTALHLAAMRGSVAMVTALLQRSEANEEAEGEKLDARRAKRKADRQGASTENVYMEDYTKVAPSASGEASGEDSDIDMLDDENDGEDEDMDATTEQSMVNIKRLDPQGNVPSVEEDEDEPDVYDVNVLAWDTAISPLHLAIVNGHIDTVRCLVQDFGADLLLPIKLLNDHDKSARASILTLVLALQLPEDKAGEMARTLIQLGASSAQADIDQVTVLQFCIADRPDQLSTLADTDKVGLMRASNHLSVSGYQWNPHITGPLLTAIESRDSLSALKLLSYGSKSQIGFSDWTKAYQTRHELPKDSKQNQRTFTSSLEQPIIVATRQELPSLTRALIGDHGIDVNSLTTDGYKRSQGDGMYWQHMQGQSLLDVVREKLEELRTWRPEELASNPPKALEDDSVYLSEYHQRPYVLWSARKQLASAKTKYKQELKDYRDTVTRRENDTGVAEKEAAVKSLMADFAKLEAVLLDRGAKTFTELYPDIKQPEKHQPYSYHHQNPDPKPFAVELNFQMPGLSSEAQERYAKLFEAAWTGDLETIKDLTLKPWKNSDDEDEPPLQVAVQDQHQLSPVAIAIIHGRFEHATVIMEIAQAQYVPAGTGKQQRYRIDDDRDEDDDEDDEDGADDVRLRSENVDEEFTIETIGEVSLQVKSPVAPLSMLAWTCPSILDLGSDRSSENTGFTYIGPRKSSTVLGIRTDSRPTTSTSPPRASLPRRDDIGNPNNLIQIALFSRDRDMLMYLLSISQHYLRKENASADEDERKSFSTISEDDFCYALAAGTPELLEEIIKYTGGGIPLGSFAKDSGVEIKPKSKFYQGLSVHGKKRADWAAAGRGETDTEPMENHHPILLEAVRLGSLKTVEWLLSDAPMRCYKEFAQANSSDARLRRLAEGADFEMLTSKFLSARSHLAIHCCLLGNDTSKDDGMLRYLISALPDTLDSRSAEGLTPLHVAFGLYDTAGVKLLLAAGADQTVRDGQGNNIIHSLLSMLGGSHIEMRRLPEMLDLMDKRILPSLFLERSAEHPGSLTPLARWIDSMRSSNDNFVVTILQDLLQYSQGQELSVINGEGDSPLHVCVRRGLHQLAEVILAHDSSLLNRENATGRTPFEMAEDAAIAAMCSGPPPMPGSWEFSTRRGKRYGLQPDWNQNVVDRHPSTFVVDAGRDRRDDREKIWDLVRETKQQLNADGQTRRRLVTLNDANEVAKRLAAQKTAENGRQHVETQSEDEVRAWLGHARARIEEQYRWPTC